MSPGGQAMVVDSAFQTVLWLYIADISLLLLHEIESAYWREWEILKLPGRISGFVLMHVPVIPLMLIGLMLISSGQTAGLWFAVAFGIIGLVPLIIHGFAVRTSNRFNLFISSAILWTCAAVGVALIVTSVLKIAQTGT